MTCSSVSFFVVVYLVQNKIDLLPILSAKLGYSWLIYLLYTAIPFILGGIAVGISKLLAKSEIKKAISLETSNNDFLANYLAFFFVALSISDSMTFWIVLGMTVLFTFFSRVSYFNPVFLIFGFNFFYVHTGENVKVLLISRKKLRSPESFEATSVRRINDYTFMEV
jgi:hypothetical protein